MARQIRDGLDYFSVDIGLFDDIKVLMAEEIIDPTGSDHHLRMIYYHSIIMLLTWIYRDKGYYIEWNEKTAIVFSKKVGTTSTLINKIIHALMETQFLNQEMYDDFSIITSKGI